MAPSAVPAPLPALPYLSPIAVPPPTVFGPQWAGPREIARPAVLAAVTITGLVGAASLTWERVGIGWFITALVGTASIYAVAARSNLPGTQDNGDVGERGGGDNGWAARAAWALAAIALMAVGAVRAAPWLFLLCVPVSMLCASLALAGGRSVRGIFLGIASVPIAIVRALPWAGRGAVAVRGKAGGGSAGRTMAAVAISAALLLIFGALLAGADAAFANIVDNILPTVDGQVITRWILTFIVVGLGMLGACFLALAPPAFDGEPGPGRYVRRIEWALPVGTLVVLFAGFVAVQATVLFGGGEHVLETAGLTYAQYARAGFWQLLTVTLLTLVVIAIAASKAPRETGEDRVWIRALLGALAVLTLVIVASALSRMWAYEQAYGFTRLRLLVSVCEVWLGILFVLVLVAGIRLRERATWVPNAILGTAVAALLGIAVLNPDAFIAERNVVRYLDMKQIDLDYLQELSADAVPALQQLPEPLRSCVLEGAYDELNSAGPDEWREWNLGRHQARRSLVGYVEPSTVADRQCWDLSRAGGP